MHDQHAGDPEVEGGIRGGVALPQAPPLYKLPGLYREEEGLRPPGDDRHAGEEGEVAGGLGVEAAKGGGRGDHSREEAEDGEGWKGGDQGGGDGADRGSPGPAGCPGEDGGTL